MKPRLFWSPRYGWLPRDPEVMDLYAGMLMFCVQLDRLNPGMRR